MLQACRAARVLHTASGARRNLRFLRRRGPKNPENFPRLRRAINFDTFAFSQLFHTTLSVTRSGCGGGGLPRTHVQTLGSGKSCRIAKKEKVHPKTSSRCITAAASCRAALATATSVRAHQQSQYQSLRSTPISAARHAYVGKRSAEIRLCSRYAEDVYRIVYRDDAARDILA